MITELVAHSNCTANCVFQGEKETGRKTEIRDFNPLFSPPHLAAIELT